MLKALLMWSSLAAAEGPSSDVVDRIVAVVGERLVLQSDIQLELALSELHPGELSQLQPPQIDPIQTAVDRAILRGLAGNAPIYAPSDAQVQTLIATMAARFPTAEAWERFLLLNGLDADRIASLMYSRLVVDRYLQRNLQRVSGESDRTSYDAWMAMHRVRTPVRLVMPIEADDNRP